MNPKQTWILVGAALALFAYIFFIERRSDVTEPREVAYQRLFPLFDPSNVSQIEIGRAESIQARRSEERWVLTSPFYPAQPSSIEALIDKISQLRRRGQISPREILAQPGGLAPFGLEPPRATITFQEGTNRHSFMVGKPTPIRDQVYVKLLGSADIFITDAAFLDSIPNSAAEWRDPLLLHLPQRPLNRIEVKSPTRGFELHRANRGWRMIQPMETRADADRIEHLIQQLRMARVQRFVSDDPGAELEQFGLNPPQLDLTLADGSDTLARIQFGTSPSEHPDLVYAWRSSHTNVVLVAKDLFDQLRLPHQEFRDRLLLSFSPADVDRIEVQAEHSFTLERRDDRAWHILGPFNMPGDPELVQEFLQNLARLEVVNFVKDVVSDFSEYGLAPPARRYVVQTRLALPSGMTNQTLGRVDFSANHAHPYLVFARRWDESSVYEISYAATGPLRLPHTAFDLRNRRIWEFPPSQVSAITIQQQGRTRELTRDPVKGWGLGEVQNTALEETLYRLAHLRAVAWVARGDAKLPLYGFAQQDYQIQLELKNGREVETVTLEFGTFSPRGNQYAAVRLPRDTERTIFEFPAPLFGDIWRDLSLPPDTSVSITP